MNPDKLSAICDLFDKAYSMAPDFGSRFYRQLSADYPETMSIFNSVNMESQHTRFVGMLSIVLHRMKGGRPFESLLQDLGKQHMKYGVKDENFADFGESLMNVLQEMLGPEFDREMRDTWIATYAEITRVMKSVGDKPG